MIDDNAPIGVIFTVICVILYLDWGSDSRFGKLSDDRATSQKEEIRALSSAPRNQRNVLWNTTYIKLKETQK
jgi:hypothetical protein